MNKIFYCYPSQPKKLYNEQDNSRNFTIIYMFRFYQQQVWDLLHPPPPPPPSNALDVTEVILDVILEPIPATISLLPSC